MVWTDKLIAWYEINKRPFVWRQTKNPYLIWLSEIIFQQTRISQGTPYYNNFSKTFPSVFDLAKAEEQKVLKLWQGLGYYSRARNLHHTAQKIVSTYNGIFPSTFAELIKLKGIGDYTASAISSICFNEHQAVVDGNVYRVLARCFGKYTPIDASYALKEFKLLASELMGNTPPGEFNQALMEFGALQCVPKNPKCTICPFQEVCVAFNRDSISQLPSKQRKIKVINRYFNYLVFRTPQRNTLLFQRKGKGIWQNLYEYPLFESSKSLTKKRFIGEVDVLKYISSKKYMVQKVNETPIKHKLSHQQLHITFWEIKVDLLLGKTIHENELINYPVPVILQKFIFNFYNLKK